MLIFEAPKRTRLHSRFCGCTSTDAGMWWSDKLHTWATTEDCRDTKSGYSSHAPCRTLKAFKGMLSRNPHMQGKLLLCSRFVGHTVQDVNDISEAWFEGATT